MVRVVVVLFHLDPRIRALLDLYVEAELLGARDSSASSPTENCSVNWLNTRNSPGLAGSRRELDALDRVADVEEAAGLPALAVHGERVAETAWMQKRLSAVPKIIVMEARDQPLVEVRLVGSIP